VIVGGTFVFKDALGIAFYLLTFIELAIALVLFLLGTLYCAMILIVVSAENLSFTAVWGRTFQIIKPFLARGVVFTTLAYISIFLLNMAMTLPFAVVLVVQMQQLTVNPGMQPPIYLRILDVAQGTIANILWAGALLISLSLYYRDCRLRIEGTDIVERLEAIASVPSN
jgi:hypothetical protein